MVAVGMAVWFGSMVRYDPTLSLVLGGILVSTLFQAGVSLIKYMADPLDKLPALTFWLMGGFSTTTDSDLLMAIVPLILGFVILLLQSWKLNVMSFGDDEARTMGVNVKRTRVLVIVASTLLASISVAVSGIIGWVGLVIPHLVRSIVGPNYKVLLPASMFVGASYLLIIDDIARLASSVEIPVGILTAIVGVPFFIVIFKRNMRGWT
jgi:iron complex transport system permease protein